MVIPRAVIDDGFFLNTFLCRAEIDMDGFIHRWRSCEGGDLQSVQALSGISITQLRKKHSGIRVNAHAHPTQAAPSIAKRTLNQNQQIALSQRAKFKNLRAGNQGAVDAEKWVLRRRTDEAHNAILDFGQQHILLRFVETMNFVHKENRPPAIPSPRSCSSNNTADIRNIALHSTQALEARCRCACDDLRQCCFTCSRWAKKDQRGNAVRLDRTPQKLPRREKMLLTAILIERARAHSRSQRRVSRHFE